MANNVFSNLVSIITPAYNAARFICQTVESVQAQTYLNWEMLVVDDCSKDDTYDIVMGYASRDSRIRLFKNDRNSGPAITRNNAIKNAKGKYIAFLDSDDLWGPEKLERQLGFMSEKDISFSFTGYRRMTPEGEKIGETIPVPGVMDYPGLLKNTAICTSTVIVDRSVVGNLKMKKTYYDDYVLWLELTKRGISAHGLSEKLGFHRLVDGSVSSNKLKSAYHVWRIYRDIEKLGSIYSAWVFSNYVWNAFRKYAPVYKAQRKHKD